MVIILMSFKLNTGHVRFLFSKLFMFNQKKKSIKRRSIHMRVYFVLTQHQWLVKDNKQHRLQDPVALKSRECCTFGEIGTLKPRRDN